MNTKIDRSLDPDIDDDERPDTSSVDWSKAPPSPLIRKPGEKAEILIDGVVGYVLRLIPSNKVLARFASTLEAWPAIIAAVESGRSPRTLSLDWVAADGTLESISAGPRLERWARRNNGEPHPYLTRARRSPRRVAESG